jgi:tRNA-uridine 2-sulfurtransferase
MLPLNNLKEKKRIVVAMSGGVDSSCVAAMLHDQGHEVIGITLQLYDHGAFIGKKGACCAGADIYDAKMVAEKIGIPHYVLDFESKFKQAVIDDFVDSYVRGETPLPCVRCNQSVKFHDLFKIAKELGADHLATGHYVRRIDSSSGPELHKGVDSQKDQSYFLFTTTKEQLEYLIFPIGNMTKEATRKLATSYGLKVADKPDSQDICFVPDGNYRKIVEKFYKDSAKIGKILHVDGFELGEHSGIINYTIGQRKRIGISYPEALYVVKIDPEQNIIYVGAKKDLKASKFVIKEVNWLDSSLPDVGFEVNVKLRSTTPSTLAKIRQVEGDKMQIELLENDNAITPGQACVIYDNNRVLGGGWITRDII